MTFDCVLESDADRVQTSYGSAAMAAGGLEIALLRYHQLCADLLDALPRTASAPGPYRDQERCGGPDLAERQARVFPPLLYGIYDLGRNTGFVNMGTDQDTSAFAVASIRGWWRAEGRRLYRHARCLLITADGGGSNGYRRRLWKVELQRLADETGLVVQVCHFPPGTSKWNKVEHRLFSFKARQKGGITMCRRSW